MCWRHRGVRRRASASGPLPCFSALVSKLEAKTPLDRARATLASNLANELARSTRVATLTSPAFDGTRAERVIVLAALAWSAPTWARGDSRGRATDPNKARLALILETLALRDGRGGFGSSEATRDAVRGSASVALGASTTDVTLEVAGAPVLARLERSALRAFAGAPDTTITPVTVAVDWPTDARVGTTGVAHVSYKVALGRDVSVWTRLPLPPGVELAAPVKNATLRQGVVHLWSTVSATATDCLLAGSVHAAGRACPRSRDANRLGATATGADPGADARGPLKVTRARVGR